MSPSNVLLPTTKFQSSKSPSKGWVPWYAVWIGIFTALVACKGAGPTGGDSGGGPGGTPGLTDATSSLGGSWAGSYVSKGDDAALNSNNGIPATALFAATDASTGTFQISLTQVKNAVASGSYRDFGGKSVLLEIQQSTISALGMPGSRPLLDYELMGDRLFMHTNSKNVELALYRANQPPPAAPASPGTGSADAAKNLDPLVNSWSCSDQHGLSWKINLRANATFVIDIVDPSVSRPPLWLDGSYELTRGKGDADAVLTVTSSNVDKYRGMEFRARQSGDTAMNLSRMRAAKAQGPDAVVEVMTCVKGG